MRTTSSAPAAAWPGSRRFSACRPSPSTVTTAFSRRICSSSGKPAVASAPPNSPPSTFARSPDLSPTSADRMARRAVVWRVAGALALVVFTASYRFNTLGGALGGFDDDHFVHFVYAKQVEAGEQPLRDFD